MKRRLTRKKKKALIGERRNQVHRHMHEVCRDSTHKSDKDYTRKVKHKGKEDE